MEIPIQWVGFNDGRNSVDHIRVVQMEKKLLPSSCAEVECEPQVLLQASLVGEELVH